MTFRDDLVTSTAARIITNLKENLSNLPQEKIEAILRETVNGEIFAFEFTEKERAKFISILGKEFGIKDLVYTEPKSEMDVDAINKTVQRIKSAEENKWLNMPNAMVVGAVLGGVATMLKTGFTVVNGAGAVVGAAVSYGAGKVAENYNLKTESKTINLGMGAAAGAAIGAGAVVGAGFINKTFFASEETEVAVEE